jgi:S-adenosylmethionine hydrolase
MTNNPLVLQTDFALQDGAVAAMYGVALELNPGAKIYNLTHEIEPYNIWDASYKLFQSVQYWPKNTVFVSVVDPGVGSARNSLCVRTTGGQFVITPNNGTLTHLKKYIGIEAIREVDVDKHMRSDIGVSHTFHGRDLYARVGSLLAGEKITFEDVGPEQVQDDIVELPIIEPTIEGDSVIGYIDVKDNHFGSIWTNINYPIFEQLGLEYGEKALVSITEGKQTIYENYMRYGWSFSDVEFGEPLIFTNSVYRMAIGLNQKSFVDTYFINYSPNAKVTISK